ncbi:MAG TPA: hypothetical protein VJR27_05895 [Candidatus Saccharimonadales bacterium]|nr:hypothetical protein [Candidatus Saccharimonadales bacterium]
MAVYGQAAVWSFDPQPPCQVANFGVGGVVLEAGSLPVVGAWAAGDGQLVCGGLGGVFLAGEAEPGLSGQQLVVGVGQFGANNVMVEYPEFLEHGLDEHELEGVGGFGEQLVGFDEHAEGVVEAPLDGFQGDGQLGNRLFGGRDLVVGAVLFGLEVGQGERFGEVGFLVLLGPFGEPLDTVLLPLDFGLAVGVLAREGGQDRRLECLEAGLRQAHPLEVVGHGLFQFGDGHVRLITAPRVVLPTEAVEVRVRHPVAVGRGGNSHAPPAAGAVQISLEWVGSFLALVLVEVAGGQEGLHGLEGVGVDERLVFAGVLDAVVGDDPHVIGVVQDAVQVLDVDGPFGQGLGFRQPESLVVQFVGERAEGVVAGGVEPETFRDERPHDGVDDDEPDVFAFGPFADVLVAERRFAGGAADLDLFAEALAGFFAEVAGVELGDGGHDAVHELAAGRLVDVLGSRDQLDAVLGQEDADLHVVFAVAGQPVEFVHDDVLDRRVFGDALEQRLEFGPVAGAGAFALVDELGDDLGVQFARFAGAILPLRLDTETLVVVAGIGLFAGGDPVVGERLFLRFPGQVRHAGRKLRVRAVVVHAVTSLVVLICPSVVVLSANSRWAPAASISKRIASPSCFARHSRSVPAVMT